MIRWLIGLWLRGYAGAPAAMANDIVPYLEGAASGLPGAEQPPLSTRMFEAADLIRRLREENAWLRIR